MAKGDIEGNDFTAFNDPFTGRKVIQLTSSEQFCHHPYFYNKSITNDNKYLIHGKKSNGTRNIFKMDLTNGLSMQLTDAEGINEFNTILNSSDKYIIFTKGNQLIKLDLNNLEEDVIYSIPEGWSTNAESTPSLSSDDKYIVLPEIKSEDIIQLEGDWTMFIKQWRKMPKCRIVIIDIEKKKSEIVFEENYWIGEVQFRPHDNDTLSFCHEGPWHKIDARIWLMNRNASNMRCVKQREGKEQFGHEYWLKDGSKIGFMHFPKFYGKDASIRFIDPITLDEEILMNCSGYSHCMSNFNNSKIVGDARGRKNSHIYLVDVKKKTEEILCSHKTSWSTYGHTQDSHPHPIFSSDGSFIIFTSDRTGLPVIYRVNL